MNKSDRPKDIFFGYQRHQPKGTVIVMVAVLLLVLLGCVALAVDIGHLYVARTELQRTADAAAMAAAQGLARDSTTPFGEYLYAEEIYSRAESFALSNEVVQQGIVLSRNDDIIVGFLTDPHDLTVALQIVPLDQANAVKVIARRTSSSGGKIPLFFAPLLGISSSAVGASAVAVLDDRFYAYGPKSMGGIAAMPFAVDEQIWNDKIVAGNGSDDYGYDKVSESVLNYPDGVKEIKLYPEQVVPGNFGILHIGSGILGVPNLRDQIRNGISKDDFVDLTGEPMIEFYEYDTGAIVCYSIPGNPGIKAGLKDALGEKLGQKVGFFIFSSVSGNGANAVYIIVGMRFGRLMLVDLHGGDKSIVVQPVPYYGPDIITSPNAPSTDRLISFLGLVR